VDIVPLHRAQALALDRGQKPLHRTVIELVRRSRDPQRQVDLDSAKSTWTLWPWLALILVPVSSKAKRVLSLPATTSSRSGRLSGKPWSASALSRVHHDPAARLQRDADSLRSVTQMQRQPLRGSNQFGLIHDVARA
jgi:hypothetical protein